MVCMVVTSPVLNSTVPWQSDGREKECTLMSWRTATKKCIKCAVVTGAGRQHRAPLNTIPVQRPFQIVRVDIMDLPCTESGNKHVVVFQDMVAHGLCSAGPLDGKNHKAVV